MITGQRSGVAAVDDALDSFLTERVAQAHAVGPAYQRLWELIRDASLGGKRVRPRLLLLAHDALSGAAHADAVTASVAFELLHTAFLLHDDVLDGDLVRRGRPNLQGAFVADALDGGIAAGPASAWGDAAGILAGDLLLSAVHHTISEVTATARPALHALVDECLFTTVAGELSDVGLAIGTVPAGIPAITRMMQDKTAAYSFTAPLRAGAMLAGATPHVQSELAEIGALLGLVYQLRDDILGVFGSPEALGKSVDGDLREGKRSLLIAFAERTDAWYEVQHLFGRRSLDAADAERLREALIVSGAKDQAEWQLVQLCEQARTRITRSDLPEALKDELLQLARRCAERDS